MVRLVSMEDFGQLPRNTWGIPEPSWEESRKTGNAHVMSWGVNLFLIRKAPSEEAGSLDVILVPGRWLHVADSPPYHGVGVCFNRDGSRLGHGKGYYDKYIQRCERFAQEHGQRPPLLGNVPCEKCVTRSSPCHTVALSLTEQLLDVTGTSASSTTPPTTTEIPREDHDRLMHILLTPSETIRIPR